ncbi:MAG TPA: glutamate-1-semialdehyde 2,1-aminomutase [Candidatus Acidoferrales bacterium]|nr:glutamate-1-semialdehyde 2,1-aminomutase [Candidatus Acidoferrales bacterium]
MTQKSKDWLERAERRIPGGVNSPVRAFRAVGGEPPFISHGSGARLFDVEGNSYIDYVCSWGPLILGHAHPEIVAALEQAARRGTSFGAPTPLEVELAEAICAAFPSIEKVRLVNSGTEAAMSALRLARAATGRKMVVKFEGGYHGHADSLLAKAGSGVATLNLPDSAGVPEEFVAFTLTLPYNDLKAVERILAERGREVAAVVVEPVAGNMGCVVPQTGFLQGLRTLTEKRGALLLFDEVITGFRVAYGGAQERFGVRADLTVLGKIIGGGLPVGAYGGRAELMDQVAPLGPVYQAGTLSGNPLAVTAGLTALRLLQQPGTYEKLEALGAKLGDGLAEAVREAGVPAEVNRCGSLLTLFFTDLPVTDYTSAKRSNTARFARFHRALLGRGVYWPPSQFEVAFVSLAHSETDIEETLTAARAALRAAR